MKKEVSYKITIINFIMTLCICNYHNLYISSYTPTKLNFSLVAYLKISNWLGDLAMVMFFMISGFLFYQNLHSVEDYNAKIGKRVKSLLFPFLIWNTFAILLDLIKGTHYFVFSFSNLASAYSIDPFNGPTWYLLALLLLMIPSKFIIKHKDNKVLITILFVIPVIYLFFKKLGIIPTLFDITPWWWWYGNLLIYLPCYLFGAYIGLYHSEFVIQEKYKGWVSLIGFFVFISLSLMDIFGVLGSWSKVFKGALIGASLWISIPSCIFKRKPGFIVDSAFFLYVTHKIGLNSASNSVLSTIFAGLCNYDWAIVLLKLLAVALDVIAMSAIIAILKLISIKKPKYFEALSGGRVKNNFSKKFSSK